MTLGIHYPSDHDRPCIVLVSEDVHIRDAEHGLPAGILRRARSPGLCERGTEATAEAAPELPWPGYTLQRKVTPTYFLHFGILGGLRGLLRGGEEHSQVVLSRSGPSILCCLDSVEPGPPTPPWLCTGASRIAPHDAQGSCAGD